MVKIGCCVPAVSDKGRHAAAMWRDDRRLLLLLWGKAHSWLGMDRLNLLSRLKKDQNLTFLHELSAWCFFSASPLCSVSLWDLNVGSLDWLDIKPASLQPTSVCALSCLRFFFLNDFYLKSVQKASDTVCTCRHWVPKIRPRSNFFRAIFTLKTPRGCFSKEYAIGVQFKVKWKEKWRLK